MNQRGDQNKELPLSVYKTESVAISKEGYVLKHDFPCFFQKNHFRCVKMGLRWKNNFLTRNAKNVLKLARG